LYRYIISEDSLIKSPKSGDALLGCIIYDLNRDNSPEFLISASATGNMNESFPYSDHYSWMMVLDKNLNFYFPPLKIVEKPSNIQLVPVNLGKQNGFVLFSDYYGTGNFVPSFFLFDQNGNILKKKPAGLIESTFSRIIPNEANNFRTFFFLINRNEVAEIDGSLNVLKTVKIPDIANPEFPLVVDADLDGKMEYILRSISKKNLIVFQHDFKFPVSAEVEKKMIEDYSITQVLKKGSKPLLYVQQRDFGSYYRYEKNVLYYFKYPLFFLLYLLIFIFIYLLSRAQRYRLNIKQQTERKIAVLQMRSIKNQIDPHFTLNILNAIGSLYATEENRDKADYIFGKYAKLIRQTVISSDQIVVTLSEEIDFVRNFIDLEKFRSDYSFKSIIDIKGDIDLQITIPRMLIYTFVENGIKYGIRNKHEGGLLRIEVYLENNKCVITVEDNGPGLQKSDISVHNTGKGLIIVNELIELYYKLEKVKITCSLENIRDKNDCIAGTKAKIIIPLKTPRNS
jgi:hypothetical protein